MKHKRNINFKEGLTMVYEKEPKELYEYALLSSGLTRKSPEVVYTTRYTIDGFVKKAGNNYILNVGKLIGKHLEIKDEDRKRSLDIYMPFARSYEYTIEIDIPLGYQIENSSLLNLDVENECGLFISESSIENQILKVKVRKQYNNSFEPLKNWDKLLKIVDAANNFSSQSIILKSIR